MHSELRKHSIKVAWWGLGIFLFFNGCSWNPGYGGRVDKVPGRQVERYFGWPACFYCDLWRSDHPHEINLPAYFPPYPLTSEMYFVYSSYAVVALLLNVLLAICGIGIVLLLLKADFDHSARSWMIGLGVGLAMLGLLILTLGDEFSAYL